MPTPLDVVVGSEHVLEKKIAELPRFTTIIVDVHSISIVFAPLADLAGCLLESTLALKIVVVPGALMWPMEFALAFASLVFGHLLCGTAFAFVASQTAASAWGAVAVSVLVPIMILALILLLLVLILVFIFVLTFLVNPVVLSLRSVSGFSFALIRIVVVSLAIMTPLLSIVVSATSAFEFSHGCTNEVLRL